jgi:hypothetical protein
VSVSMLALLLYTLIYCTIAPLYFVRFLFKRIHKHLKLDKPVGKTVDTTID